MTPRQRPLIKKCAAVMCQTLVTTPLIVCPDCRAYFLSLPSDAALARGDEAPAEPAGWAAKRPGSEGAARASASEGAANTVQGKERDE